MLCQFRFTNFKSYRDETILDMEAETIEELSDTLFPPPGDNFKPILPLAVLFGPNAGGKSNAIAALAYLVSRVVSPIIRSTGDGNPFGMILKEYTPFLFDASSKTEPTRFELTFRTQRAQYDYCLSLLNNEVEDEALRCIKTPCTRRRSVLLFQRTRDSIEPGRALKKANREKVSRSIPYLSFLAINYNYPEIADAVAWFERCLIQNYAIEGSDHRVFDYMVDPEVKPLLLSFLKAMDIPISDYRINAEETRAADKENGIITIHTVNNTQYELELRQESEGTIKVFSALPGILYSLASGGLVLFDEFDAKLHPLLLRYLIDVYSDPELNPKHAQFIFTCHDVSIMRSEYLRRDEIWFAAQNSDSASELWSLYDILDENGAHVKSTTAYNRQYLAGRYGADPYLKRMKNWRDRNGDETQTP